MARKKFQRKKLQKTILKLSEGVLSRVTDVILFELLFGLNLLGKSPTSRGAWQAITETEKDLTEINYQTVKRSFLYLKKKGLIKYIKEEAILKPQITEAGKKRLSALVPFYDGERVWDGKLYLVTYDVPEEQKSDRETLRDYLQRIGCGMFQKSVWITPYNPKETLREFISDRGLEGCVVVSDLGEDGSVGDRDLKELIAEIYHLDELNDRYREFMEKFQKPKTKVDPAQVSFGFLSILADDPQLPFELLPDDWVGDDAYEIYRKFNPQPTTT